MGLTPYKSMSFVLWFSDSLFNLEIPIVFALYRMMETVSHHPHLGIKEAAIAKSQCVWKNIVNATRFNVFALPILVYMSYYCLSIYHCHLLNCWYHFLWFMLKRLMLVAQVDVDVRIVKMSMAGRKVRKRILDSLPQLLMAHYQSYI